MTNTHLHAGVLAGLKIVEMAGMGPAPFACMMLADHGAEVIRVERIGGSDQGYERIGDIMLRSRRVIQVDLKSPKGIAIVRRLAASADGLVEGYRPGVMERLGLGPDVLAADNPRLVYGRMTGWGQNGPYAHAAGHDINYVALSGTLHALGRAGEKPTPPINLVGDFGGGGMMLAFGMLGGILSARMTGCGQVVDCAMTDGAALLMSMMWAMRGQGGWNDARGTNMLDTGAHFYDSYETADGQYIAVGAIEAAFYADLRRRVGLEDDPDFDAQMDVDRWPVLRERLAAVFRTRSRAEWCEMLEYSDACFAPVLSMAEAPAHPHNAERGAFLKIDDIVQPAPAPRFSATPARGPVMPGVDTASDAILAELGYSSQDVANLRADGVVS